MMPPSPAPAELATGVQFGSYVVGELIGRGAMASVYRAEHVLLAKPVALKLMDDSLLQSPEARERFLREGRVVASITHPNVVDVTDVGVHEGTPYLVMELLVGEDLHSYLERHAPLDDRTTVRLALPLIAALAAAHEVNVVHRDVKPSNIFLEQGPTGEIVPKVLDFGISKLSLERTGLDLVATSPNQLIGSPLYLPPEALRGSAQLGPASDQYSLGVVLYQCLTGRTPFHGDTLMELLGALARGSFLPPRALRPEISPALERVIVRAMALDPRERFPSLREMGAALLGLAAERTQVVWASSFQPPAAPSTLAEGGAQAPASGSFRPAPAPYVPPDARQTTPIPALRPSRRLWWLSGGAAALLVLGALWVGQRAAAPSARAVAASPAPRLPAASIAPAPVVAVVQQPAAADPAPAAADPAPAAAAEPEALESKALVTRLRALQATRSPRASAARERRTRSRRSAAETSETAAASAVEAEAREATRRSPPATPAAPDTAGRRGANQSPFLD
ncbi:MAG TPA: serine/threonine-protein kinase [Polyangiaceae bacterium]|nr:serine/threonine-protein kinase [Polyangiaceae bacterium]